MTNRRIFLLLEEVYPYFPIVGLALVLVLYLLLLLRVRELRSGKESLRVDSGDYSPVEVPLSSTGSDILFATLSHELRTPLNGLLGVVQMLNEERDDEDLQAIEGCARHMLAVLSTLVNHAKIQSEGKGLAEYREWVSPFELL